MEDTVKLFVTGYITWNISFSLFDRLLHEGRIANIKKKWVLID